MKCGVDFGSSLTKVVWNNELGFQYKSTADTSLDSILAQMKTDLIINANVAGIGKKDQLHGLIVKSLEGDSIENELKLQAEGVRRIIPSLPNKFLIVPIGTGTSYSLIEDNKLKRFPYGNHFAGGYLKWRAALSGAVDFNDFISQAAKGKPLDLLVKDMIPEKSNSFEGQFVVASTGKATISSTKEDICETAINDVVTITLRDLLILDMVPDFHGIENIVYLGSSVARIPQLKTALEIYTSLIGKKPYFSEQGEFALAMGAYHMDSPDRVNYEIVPLDGYTPAKGSTLAKLRGFGLLLKSKLT